MPCNAGGIEPNEAVSKEARRAAANMSDVWTNRRQVARAKFLVVSREWSRLEPG